MSVLVVSVLSSLGVALAYVYGCAVGLREGRRRGQAEAERTFADWLVV